MAHIRLIIFLMLVCDVFSKHNEWYCRIADDKNQVCRKCKDDTCEANSQDDNVGNEEFLNSTKIVGDVIKEVLDDGILGDDLFFWLDYAYECQNECKSRIGLCGAWSFDNSEGRCYLHTIDGCCGQYGKREVNSDWISGYVCRQCWSTLRATDCPCSIRDRASRPKTKQGADETPTLALAVRVIGSSVLHATSSGSLTIKRGKGSDDRCKCVPKRTLRGRFRCLKPFCSDLTLNNNEMACPKGCCDKRKCRQATGSSILNNTPPTTTSTTTTSTTTTSTTTTRATSIVIEEPKKPCTTKDGKKCRLPFIYRGEKHEACPQDPQDPNETWCSTLINIDGEHIVGGGHYGFCGDNCPKIFGSIKVSEND